MHIQLQELKELKGTPLKLNVTFDFEEELKRRNADLLGLSTTTFNGEAAYMAGFYRVHGKIESDLKLSCSRCLTEIIQPLGLDFDQSFIPEDTDVDVEDEGEIQRLEKPEIELEAYLKEEILLNIPYVPLCDEACKGLCPQCGVDRNKKECSCNTERIDPRMAELEKFFDQDKD